MAKSLADITLYSLIRQRRETLIIGKEFQNSTNLYLDRFFYLIKNHNNIIIIIKKKH